MPFPVLSPFRYTHDKTKMTGTVVRASHPDAYTFTPGFTGAEGAPVYMPNVPMHNLRWLFRVRYWDIKNSAAGDISTHNTTGNNGQEQKEINFYADANTHWMSFRSEQSASRYLRRIIYEFEPGALKMARRQSGWGLEHERLGEVLVCGQEIIYFPRVMAEEVCRTGVVWLGPETGNPWDGSVVTRVVRDYVSPEIGPLTEDETPDQDRDEG